MKLARRHVAPELTLNASRAILAVLAFAASVSAVTAGALPPQVLAGVLIVTVDAGGGIEAITAPRPEAQPARTFVAVSVRTCQHIFVGVTPLDERLTDLPPPAMA